MYFKFLGSVIIGVLLLIGCQQGGNEQPQNQQESPGNQPGQMPQQQGDINVSDADIEKFVEAASNIQKIMRQDMGKAIDDEGMARKRFQEIQKSQQSRKSSANTTEEELKKFRAINKKMQEKMQQAIKDAGLTQQRYQQITKAAQKDPELMKKLKKKLQENMKSSQ